MSITEDVPATRTPNDVERLLQELAATPGVQFRVDAGDGLFIIWLGGESAPRCGCHADTWWTAGSDGWHLMSRFDAVQRIRFVREPDAHQREQETLSVRFFGAGGGASLRASFIALYDDRGQPIPAPFARWKELRASYGGQDEVPVRGGMIEALPANYQFVNEPSGRE